jgi:uncharacterized membrane protein
MASGMVVVVASTYVLRDHVRKVKQADMKIAVSALLFSFATFWLGEAITPLTDFILIPLFAFFVVVVYKFATRASPAVAVAPEAAAEGGESASRDGRDAVPAAE